jgi:hypothetical protein
LATHLLREVPNRRLKALPFRCLALAGWADEEERAAGADAVVFGGGGEVFAQDALHGGVVVGEFAFDGVGLEVDGVDMVVGQVADLDGARGAGGGLVEGVDVSVPWRG